MLVLHCLLWLTNTNHVALVILFSLDKASTSSSEASISSSVTKQATPSAWKPKNGELVEIVETANKHCERVGKFEQIRGGWFRVNDLDGTSDYACFRNTERNHIKPATAVHLQEQGSVSPADVRAAVAEATVPSPLELPGGTTEADVRAALAKCDRVNDRFKRLKSEEDIVVSRLPTAQGKESGTAAGCSIISGLLVCRSLAQKGPISDADFQRTIVNDAGLELLGLRGAWHSEDYLSFETAVEKLYESWKMVPYVFIRGGNILDDGHFANLMSHFEVDGRVLGCFYCLQHYVFFAKYPVACPAEHSISSKTPEYVYDLIESLPAIDNRFGYPMRSKNLDAFKVALKNYALQRLYLTNSSFGLAEGPWLENSPSDADPRNFQAWIWT